MNMKTVLFYNIALFLVLASCVQASLYPTRPIKNTVYLAGKAARVMWIEGGRKPLLTKMGTVQIDLYTGHDVSAFIFRVLALGVVLATRIGAVSAISSNECVRCLCRLVLSATLQEVSIKKLLSYIGTYPYDCCCPQTYVATLAKNVPATSGSTTCFIPADVPSNALSLYVLSLPHSLYILSLTFSPSAISAS